MHFSPTAACPVPCTMYHVIKAISPCVRSASAKLFLDLHTVLAPREWRGAHVGGSRTGRTRRAGAAAGLTEWHARVVWPCHCHGLGLISLRAARERLPPV